MSPTPNGLKKPHTVLIPYFCSMQALFRISRIAFECPVFSSISGPFPPNPHANFCAMIVCFVRAIGTRKTFWCVDHSALKLCLLMITKIINLRDPGWEMADETHFIIQFGQYKYKMIGASIFYHIGRGRISVRQIRVDSID